jgi:uncharacterized protein (DUF1501 family)
MDRRQFLCGMLGVGAAAGLVQVTGLGGLLRLAEASASGTSGSGSAATNGPLVLCTLYGGNDGLNTVIPYETGTYHDWRAAQGLAIGADQALALGTAGDVALGLHPAMPTLQSLWQAGKVAVVNGVEYPNPNFSHFQSEDIWQTAELSGDEGTGWLGRWLDRTGTDPWRALSVGATLPPALVGAAQQATSLVDSTNTNSQMPGANSVFTPSYREMMGAPAGRTALQRGQAAAGTALLEIGFGADAALAAGKPPSAASGRNAGDIGTQLGLVAELITYGLPTSVYSVSWGSFDTHSAQAGTHAQLLGQLDAAIEAFMSVFPAASPHRSPVILVTSEFGRTPMANASAGTDHSTSSVVLAVGPGVHGGFYGEVPSFTRLDQYGNQRYTTDFRSVYATVLEDLLGMPAGDVLGGRWSSLGFL